MNNGSVMSGYQFSRVMAEWNTIPSAPLPHRARAKPMATAPITAKMCRPVRSMTIIETNIRIAISS